MTEFEKRRRGLIKKKRQAAWEDAKRYIKDVKHLTQNDLADLLGCGVRTIQAWKVVPFHYAVAVSNICNSTISPIDLALPDVLADARAMKAIKKQINGKL